MTILQAWWRRARAFFARVFGRGPPSPGRLDAGSKFSARGFVAVAPMIWPRRDYLVYVPAGRGSLWRRRAMIVLLHGCRQTAEDIAQASRITALADELDCLVLLPKQNPKANSWGCWNWFDPRTAAGAGEAAIVAAQIRSVRRRYRVHRRRVFAVGMSSGAGLAAVLALRNSGLLAGAVLHSGIAAGAASSPLAALDVLKRGPDVDVVSVAEQARAADGAAARVPVLVIQGAGDDVVAPLHASEIARQMLAFAGFPGVLSAPEPLPPPTWEHAATIDGRRVVTREWRSASHLLARLVLIDGLGHAWAGGDGTAAYTDPHGPAATDLIRQFVTDVR